MEATDSIESMCSCTDEPPPQKTVTPRGCASDQFPGKLFDLLEYCEKEGMTDIISWVGNGKAIMVRDPDRLLALLPRFHMSQTKYRSFQRQL
jgi:hypothetical protein